MDRDAERRVGGCEELPRKRCFGRPENHSPLLLSPRLSLTRHGFLQGHWDGDVSYFH